MNIPEQFPTWARGKRPKWASDAKFERDAPFQRSFDELHRLSRYSRKHPTRSEKILWEHLKGYQLGERFTRQRVVCGYIADFFCKKLSLIIEVDGKYHKPERDSIRDRWLVKHNFTVLRFTNKHIDSDINGVIRTIITAISLSSHSAIMSGRRGQKPE